MDLRCACPGVEGPARPVQCEEQADGEDGLCSNCRRRGCPNSPLGWFVQRVDEAIREGRQGVTDELIEEYRRRCLEAGEPP